MSIVIRAGLVLLLVAAQTPPTPLPPRLRDQVCRHRNLGKAYYENPVTQMKAADEFKQALPWFPTPPRPRQLWAGLAAGRSTEAAVLQLQRAQKEDPSIPHTWFNLGMAFKKQFDHLHAVDSSKA